MAMTSTKRTLDEALKDARDFYRMFPSRPFDQWMVAGSVRRQRPEVGDVEHVIVPQFGDVASADLFATPARANLLWARLDELVADATVIKHLYGDTGFRWGDKYRGIDFRGHLHEMFSADPDNFGPTLAIRTGPPDFSRRLVTGLLRNGLRNHKGYVWRCEPCFECRGNDVAGCKECDGTGLVTKERMTVPTEERYFDLAGVPWAEPKDRL